MFCHNANKYGAKSRIQGQETTERYIWTGKLPPYKSLEGRVWGGKWAGRLETGKHFSLSRRKPAWERRWTEFEGVVQKLSTGQWNSETCFQLSSHQATHQRNRTESKVRNFMENGTVRNHYKPWLPPTKRQQFRLSRSLILHPWWADEKQVHKLQKTRKTSLLLHLRGARKPGLTWGYLARGK